MTKDKRWIRYYDAVVNQPARQPLVTALNAWECTNEGPGIAIDLGCGTGRDTYALLHRDWHVLAIDKEAEAIRRLLDALPVDLAPRLTTQVSAFEAALLPAAQLINASFSLPFCPPDKFEALWQQIVDSLSRGGIFAGQIFGERDSWAQNEGMTFHNRHQLDERLRDFDIVELTEVDKDGVTATGKEKHWHYFEVIARKKG